VDLRNAEDAHGIPSAKGALWHDASPKEADSDFMARKHHNVVRIVAWIAILIALFFICMGIGRATISPFDVVGILAGSLFGIGDMNAYAAANVDIIINVRLPIVVAAILCGAALATSGATYQGLFRNPLVSPDLLGASAGAAFGAALGLLWQLPNIMVQLFAFVGGFIAVLITYFSAKYLSRGVNQILLLVLAGMIVQTLFKSFLSAIKYIADPYSTLPAITYWLMGSLAKVTWESIAMFMIPFDWRGSNLDFSLAHQHAIARR
jgi:iron complex transport system permease protein